MENDAKLILEVLQLTSFYHLDFELRNSIGSQTIGLNDLLLLQIPKLVQD
jgi:hypothetical protein